MAMGRKENTLENIMSNAIRNDESGCLLYMGRLDENGYARIHYRTLFDF